MSSMRYTAQAFLDGFTSMTSIFWPARRPGSEEPLFLAESTPETNADGDRTIMADVEHFLREIEPLILEDQTVHRESQVLLKKIQKSQAMLTASQGGT